MTPLVAALLLWAAATALALLLINAHTKLSKIRVLYDARCEATTNHCTDGEEMFLADLGAILNGEDDYRNMRSL